MRLYFSILKEIHDKNFIPTASDYGLSELDFEKCTLTIERQGLLERVLRVNDQYSLKPARVSEKGLTFLEEHKDLFKSYPQRSDLKVWVRGENPGRQKEIPKKQKAVTHLNYETIKTRIDTVSSCIQQKGGKVKEIILDQPAAVEEVQQIEKTLGLKLPKSFKKVLLEFSAHFSMSWFLPDTHDQPEEFREIFSGTPSWNLKALPMIEENRKSWEDSMIHFDDEYDSLWNHTLAFCEVGNGDFLAFDLQSSTEAPIIYLDHEHGPGHGVRLADNFTELLENWSRLAFIGCEDFQWLPFTTSHTSGLQPDGDAAKRFRAWLGFMEKGV